jgi:t-SNARE complex subunit (syntaxin)
MRSLTLKFEDKARGDRVQALNLQVQDVQGIVGDSIQQVLRNTESAEAIGAKSQDMRNTAQVFHSDARKLERIMYWRKVKLNIVIACVVIAIILYIVVPIAVVYSN